PLILYTLPSPPLSSLFPYTTLFRSTLTLAFSGNGSGSVTSTGAPLPQFSCTDTAGVASGTCSANLNNNDLVNFTATAASGSSIRSEEHTSELQSRSDLVCRLLLVKK